MTKNYISNKDESPRMFKSDILEAFSKVHWSTPLFIFIPIILYSLYRSHFVLAIDIELILLYFIIGLIVWTLTEYLLHRFIFHYQPSSKFGQRLHFIFHGVHHDYPNDSKRLVMPPSVSLPLATLFFFLFQSLFGMVLVFPFFAGFILGYLFYDMTHYAVHHYNMKNKFWLYIKKHHMLHHYKHSDKGFGVSQPAWDYVFNTKFPE